MVFHASYEIRFISLIFNNLSPNSVGDWANDFALTPMVKIYPFNLIKKEEEEEKNIKCTPQYYIMQLEYNFDYCYN